MFKQDHKINKEQPNYTGLAFEDKANYAEIRYYKNDNIVGVTF